MDKMDMYDWYEDDIQDEFSNDDDDVPEMLVDVWSEYKRYLDTLDNDDYVVNREQMNKLVAMYEFFSRALSETSGRVEISSISPKELHGGIDAHFNLLYMNGDILNEFGNIIKLATAVSIDALLDGTVNISISIRDIFKHK